MARIQRVIDDGVSFYEHQIERDEGVTLYRGHARFVSEHELECGGRRAAALSRGGGRVSR